MRSDSDLVSAASAGDQSALAEIYDRYADRIHDFLPLHVARPTRSGRRHARHLRFGRFPLGPIAGPEKTAPVAVRDCP